MLKNARSLSLDICDYNNNALCSLYDNTADVSGQATDVYVKTERNGWKELSFKLPATCLTAEGEEPNYRLQYLIADYRIRLQVKRTDSDDIETDWFLVSEPKISHDQESKTYEIVADHISSLLKTKNLGLEFSDEEGNNTGTVQQIANTILEGTGWHIQDPYYVFEEDKNIATTPGQEKVRSFVASAKTGAFKMMSDLCEKFDAKPVYHGEGVYQDENGNLQTGRTVEIIPMNPFSEVEGEQIPKEVLEGENVLELHYNRNLSSVKRTLDSRNLVTKLYAYGAYGDADLGLCSMMNCDHNEYKFTLGRAYSSGQEFSFQDESHAYFYFKTTESLSSGTVLIWSELDPLSKSYIYNPSSKKAYKVYKTATSNSEPLTWVSEPVKNKFEYLMNFDYYNDVNLLTDEMLQTLAKYQREMPEIIDEGTAAATNLIQSKNELSEVAESNTGFLRLAVRQLSYSTGNSGETKLVLDKSVYPDGIMYRSDYLEAKRNYFSWYCASQLKDNGDPVHGIGSVVYIIHDTNPQTWEKAYVKYIDDMPKTHEYGKVDSVDPSSITLWLDSSKVPAWKNTDRFYLFCSNSISGRLGVREGDLESLEQTLQTATKTQTEIHPTYFVWDNDPAPTLTTVSQTYGWYYRSSSADMNNGSLYFCYGNAGDNGWHNVIISDADPVYSGADYYFNTKKKTLYHGVNGVWEQYTDTEGKRLANNFSKVVYYCLRHDMIYKGLYDKYSCNTTAASQAGNYAIDSGFGFYWAFSTDRIIPAGKEIWIDTIKGLAYGNDDESLPFSPEAKPFDVIDFPIDNEFVNVSWTQGTLNKLNGVEVNSNSLYRSTNLTVHPNTTYTYNLPAGGFVLFFDVSRRFIKDINLGATGDFDTTNNTKYIRFVIPAQINLSTQFLRVKNHDKRIFVSDKEYTVLDVTPAQNSERIGIMYLIKKFADVADRCYTTDYPAYLTAQEEIRTRNNQLASILGDLYREGYWQKNDYVEGDETKLYKDALDTIVKIAKPEAKYEINFLDLYGTNPDMGMTVDESDNDPEWPDVKISDAIHLIDDDIDINCWAFIDKIEKCYDKPWQTRIEINTNLSLIGQKTFADVMTYIAEVANQAYGNQSIYKRAGAISGAGKMAAERLEGAIKANTILINGATSNWYTDEKGAIVLESADGLSAMKLTGAGFAVASSKDQWGDWNWRTFGTGQGFTADEIIAGEMSAIHILAGSITVDQINASVGQELDIGSNKSLLLYSTVDGLRPAGSLQTQVSNGDGTFRPINAGDSYISIAAQEGNTPAEIDIMTGGKMYLQGSTMDLRAQSELNILGSTVNIQSLAPETPGEDTLPATMNINSGGSLNITSAGEFTVDSQNFKVLKNNNVEGGYKVEIKGKVTSDEGCIAGFTLGEADKGKATHRQYLQAGNTDSVSSSGVGVYLGTDGINLGGGKFIYQIDSNNNPTLTVNADTIVLGSDDLQTSLDDLDQSISDNVDTLNTTITNNVNTLNTTITNNVNTINETINSKDAAIHQEMAQRAADAAAATEAARLLAVSKSKNFRCPSTGEGSITTQNYEVGDTWTNTDAKTVNGKTYHFYYQYICTQVSNPKSATNDWVMTGTALTAGASLLIDTNSGTIDMVAANTINVVSGSTMNISAGESLTITSGTALQKDPGYVKIGNGSAPFIIGANATEAYIYNGKTNINDDTTAGIYIGTNGIRLGRGLKETEQTETQYFTYTPSGGIEVRGTIKATSLEINGTGSESYVNTLAENKANAAANAVASNVSQNYVLKTTFEGFQSTYESNYNGLVTKTSIIQDGKIAMTAVSGLASEFGKYTTTETLNSTYAKKSEIQIVPDKISAFTFDSITKEGSAVSITPNAITLSSTGALLISSGNFQLDASGNATILGGSISIKNSSNVETFAVSNTGSLTAKSGEIGGWTFNSLRMYKLVNPDNQGENGYYIGMDAGDPGSLAFWAGKSQQTADLTFRVTKAGVLYATGVNISGVLTATSGTFTGNINANGGRIGSFTIAHNADSGWAAIYSNSKSSKGAIAAGNGTYTCPAGIYIGTDGIGVGTVASNVISTTKSPFWVDSNGNLSATKGTIGGWHLGSNYLGDASTLANSTVGINSDTNDENVVFWAGSKDRASAPFLVTHAGLLKATNVDIKGKITSTEGNIAGWTLSDNLLSQGSNAGYVGMGYTKPANEQGYSGYWCGSDYPWRAPLGMFIYGASNHAYLQTPRLVWMEYTNSGVTRHVINLAGVFADYPGTDPISGKASE